MCSPSDLDRSAGRLWSGSVGRDAPRRPSGPGRLERVGRSGHSDANYFRRATRGRSVGRSRPGRKSEKIVREGRSVRDLGPTFNFVPPIRSGDAPCDARTFVRSAVSGYFTVKL